MVGFVVCNIVCVVVSLRLCMWLVNGVLRCKFFVCLVMLLRVWCSFLMFWFMWFRFDRVFVLCVVDWCVRLSFIFIIWLLNVVRFVCSVVNLLCSFVIWCFRGFILVFVIIFFLIRVFCWFKFCKNKFKCVFRVEICVLVVVIWCCSVFWCFCICVVCFV